MKYYFVVGEASGDLHASNLMKAIKQRDADAEFRFFGGDNMKAVGGTMVKHYKELAYMGFIPVMMHLRTILGNMKMCKNDIVGWKPDVLILVDYPGFNLDIAKFIHAKTNIPVYYYIAPKIWAWKEYRIKNIKRDVDKLFSILPFEVDFFEKKHNYPIQYVGNPTLDEVEKFKSEHNENFAGFTTRTHLEGKPIIALLSGSRKQEIADNLPLMVEAVRPLMDRYQVVVAGAPSIDMALYDKYLSGTGVKVVPNETYSLLMQAEAALVTSGTATLETALFGVPQVVCYYLPFGKVYSFLRRFFLKIPYVSLVNLVLGREGVKELIADGMTVEAARAELLKVLNGGEARDEMLASYAELKQKLGETGAPEHAAKLIIESLS
ncbi:MAG: lipid-A-disaccharide synthase [Bacteroidaceae bacterium]|nr:lipid-A-disaccharide synthase [Bacteroidaceae bacterium]MBQ1676979.1 lipid-A-disaccharide synthase [Bacteroidaceae bacterium]MBQ5476268.1 lipid-A-disaccharide synthase [Bacteroidaceae bacterium]MBQ7484925.1 lipid-A-disaccharide synthase [Bacteroidaceae bacterium]